MMTSDYPDPSFSGDFLPVERVCHARYNNLKAGKEFT
mgnify:CR=1 FL=1